MSEIEAKLTQAASLATKGKVSRREFVQLALAAGLTIPGANALFTRAAHASPRKGGTFRLGIGHGSTTASMDPGLYTEQFTGTSLWGTLSNGLVEIDDRGNAVPDLAESFEPSESNKKWLFKLRPGATFHDGKEVTAEDVVASVNHHLGSGSKSSVKSLLEPIVSVKADSKLNVLFELQESNPDFPYIFSDYHLPIMPAKEDGSADWSSGVRTGAYVLDKWEPGVTATFNRNPNYFKPDRGWFDRVETLSIIDSTARTNALTSGEIDYLDRCDLRTLHLLKMNPAITIYETVGYGHYVFNMNTTVAPFDNKEIRRAIKYSLNRQDILEKVFSGYGIPGNDNPISPAVKFAFDPQPRHEYDPELVRSILKKEGAENLTIPLSVSDAAFGGAVDAALLWQSHAKAAGLNLDVTREPNDGYWDNVPGKKPFFASYWNGRPTCDWLFSTIYAADAAYNETQWKDPRFNELLVAARSESDEAKRAAMYAEMQQLIHDEGGLINLIFNSYVDAHSNKLAHGAVSVNWPMDGMKVAERWWFTE